MRPDRSVSGRRWRTLNIAHRGSSGAFPENTIAAFLAAANEGAQMCELDVAATRDGAVVVIHDDTVDRTTNGTGAVEDFTLKKIQRLDAGEKFDPRFRGERIPTLEQVLKAVRGKLGLNIEIKEGAVEREVCELIRKHDALATSMVSSFDWKALATVQAIDPQIRIALLAEKNRDALIEAAWKMGAYAVNPRFDLVDAAFCAKAHARGLQVLVWTVDAPEAMRALIGAGVDGIMTNYPARLREVVVGR
ncbi:MAG TPA: glycerophosphodiester phosphodiesterase family protein [Candidatus Binataceae bacterium]|nr:glycerophosphodiester phosphodiesterase family protein [Candidatus Binataceae bacterium]